jgi:hypothetical protein
MSRSEGKAKDRRGAPSLPTEYLDRILQLRRQGLNPAQIADRFGQPKDRVRHQVKIAEKRYRDAVEEARKLGAAQWDGGVSTAEAGTELPSEVKRRGKRSIRQTKPKV